MIPIVQEDFNIMLDDNETMEEALIDALASFIQNNTALHDLQDGVIRFSFLPQTATAQRAGKEDILEVLEVLTISAKEDACLWYDGDYAFNFKKRVYVYRKDAIHFTALEQLVLYKLLIEKVEPRTLTRLAQVRQSITRRFGKEFLKGVL